MVRIYKINDVLTIRHACNLGPMKATVHRIVGLKRDRTE